MNEFHGINYKANLIEYVFKFIYTSKNCDDRI